MGARIVIDIGGGHRGFLISLAQLVARDHDVTIVAGLGFSEVIKRIAPELQGKIEVRPERSRRFDETNIIRECREREEKYGEYFSMISSHDRGLGKGYIFNADKHPDMVRSWWSHERKLVRMLEDFTYYENLINKYSPDVLIQTDNDKIACLVSRHHGVVTLALITARIGSRYLWVEDEYLDSALLSSSLREHLSCQVKDGGTIERLYEQVAAAKSWHDSTSYSYRTALRDSVRRVSREAKSATREAIAHLVLRRPVKYANDGYRYFGWIGPILRRPAAYRYFKKHGVRPEELAGYRLVYFPLHLEPEFALLTISPEFNNSMEAIAWISKSLPADARLVVKEQPLAFGIRSRHYYDNFRRMGNVALAHPAVHSWDWIKASRLTATVTGTAGFEAVHFRRPVLSFGKHQLINQLPTVRYASDFDSTRNGIRELLDVDPDPESFEKAARALHMAQIESSFELPGLDDRGREAEPRPELARIAVDHLYGQYAAIFRVGNEVARGT